MLLRLAITLRYACAKSSRQQHVSALVEDFLLKHVWVQWRETRLQEPAALQHGVKSNKAPPWYSAKLKWKRDLSQFWFLSSPEPRRHLSPHARRCPQPARQASSTPYLRPSQVEHLPCCRTTSVEGHPALRIGCSPPTSARPCTPPIASWSLRIGL